MMILEFPRGSRQQFEKHCNVKFADYVDVKNENVLEPMLYCLLWVLAGGSGFS